MVSRDFGASRSIDYSDYSVQELCGNKNIFSKCEDAGEIPAMSLVHSGEGVDSKPRNP